MEKLSFHIKSGLYNPTYLKFCFIESRVDVSKPKCVICGEILYNDAMKPSKLKRHQETKHPSTLNLEIQFFERKRLLNVSNSMIKNSFSKTNKDLELATKISYHVSFNIAKAKKPHNIGEELIKHCYIEMVSLLQSDEAAK